MSIQDYASEIQDYISENRLVVCMLSGTAREVMRVHLDSAENSLNKIMDDSDYVCKDDLTNLFHITVGCQND